MIQFILSFLPLGAFLYLILKMYRYISNVFIPVDANQVICVEQFGSEVTEKVYVGSKIEENIGPKYSGYVKIYKARNQQSNNSDSLFERLTRGFKSAFLPQGYPESVSEDYLEYQIWDTAQAFASSITGTLATRAILEGYGVGDESSTATAATITWLMKDGTGMVGRIIFAWSKSLKLDADPKRWRLFADILNDLAIFLDIIAPGFKNFFTPIVCFSGFCRSLVGVAGGATRAALTVHQARRNNMADVSAKDGSQETLVNLAALICSLTVIPLVSTSQQLVWIFFMIFTAIHLYANYKAVTSVVMETINSARLHILVNGYLSLNGYVHSVYTVNKSEPVLFSVKNCFKIHMGASFRCLLRNTRKVPAEMKKPLCTIQAPNNNYLLYITGDDAYVILRPEASELDQVRASFQIEVINFITHVLKINKPNELMDDDSLRNIYNFLKESQFQSRSDSCEAVSQDLQHFTNIHFPKFCEKLVEKRWKLSPVFFCADEWRCKWDFRGMCQVGGSEINI